MVHTDQFSIETDEMVSVHGKATFKWKYKYRDSPVNMCGPKLSPSLKQQEQWVPEKSSEVSRNARLGPIVHMKSKQDIFI